MVDPDQLDSHERFAKLAAARARSAFRLAGYLLGDAFEAEDAVQDAFERAWRAWPRLREESSFGPWFDRILINVCRDRGRHRRRNQDIDTIPDALGHVPDPFRAIFERDAIGRAIAALPPDQRVVIVLRFWRDLSLDEIADLTDVPLGTVKSRLHYGVDALRGAMSRAALLEVPR